MDGQTRGRLESMTFFNHFLGKMESLVFWMGRNGLVGGGGMNKLISHKDKKKKFVYDGSQDVDMKGVDDSDVCDFDNKEDVSSGDGLKTTMVDRFLSKRMENILNKEK